MLVFDLETGALPDEQLRELMPPFDESKVKHPGEFDPAKVKYGRTKDEAKRAEILEAARAKHAEECEAHESNVAAARQKCEREFLENAALSATTGRIVAVGLYRPDNDGSSIIPADDEAAVLTAFWKKYQQCRETNTHLVGFNIFGFDLPFLMQRSWIHGLDVPATLLASNRYFDSIFVDLMQVWGCGRFNGFASLDSVARALGVGTKNGDGKDFARLWNEDRAAAVEYLKNDLKLTAGVARRMGIV